MNTNIINIKITGYGSIYWICDIINPTEFSIDGDVYDQAENDVIGYPEEVVVFLSDIRVEADGNLLEKKGKYIKRKDYFSKMFTQPSVAYFVDETEIECSFQLILSEDDEFDPSKLQLVKSDYEFDFIPYGILPDCIVYDGREIPCIPDSLGSTEFEELYYEEKVYPPMPISEINYKLPYVK